MKKIESTHIVFDGKSIFVSPNLRAIFSFMMDLEKETENFLFFEKKLSTAKEQILKLLDVLTEIAKKKKNIVVNINIKDTDALVKNFKFDRPARCECIVLFAYLETLRYLYTAYKKNTTDDKKLRDASDSAIDDFLKNFCLCPKNEWVKNNPQRAKRITVANLRKLRNLLTHFFSIYSCFVITSVLNEDYLKLEKDMNYKVSVLSSEDLYQIIQGAAHLLLKMWNADCQRSIKENNSDFKERIHCVNAIVEKNGAVLIKRREQ